MGRKGSGYLCEIPPLVVLFKMEHSLECERKFMTGDVADSAVVVEVVVVVIVVVVVVVVVVVDAGSNQHWCCHSPNTGLAASAAVGGRGV